MIVVAVTKGQSIKKIQDAIQSGYRIFGENYLQEALPKIHALQHQNLEWHFIGKIQSNKTREIAEHFDWVQSLDNLKIAERLNNQRPESRSPLQVCIEINNSHLPQKPGISLADLPDLIKKLNTLPHLHWRGLMTTITEEYELVAQTFFQLQQKGYPIDILSMGMSSDYKKAIDLGATMIRLGTAIFGERQGR